ncbi:hypothetical protein ACLB2K_007227 [Fragaria x ananassa]
MQTEARVRVVVDGGAQRALHAGHGGVAALLAGGVAGALAKTCTAPLARLTILFQIQGMHSDVATMRKASIWREASRIVGEEGFRAFWKGNLVTIAHRFPYSSVNFYSYEQYKKILQTVPGLKNSRDNMSTDICVHFVGGGLAGITAATATYPLDLVRTRLAAQTNVMSTRALATRCELLAGMRAQRHVDSTVLVSLACGSLSGIASSTGFEETPLEW